MKQILDKNQSTSNNDSKKMIGHLMNLIKELLYDESTKNLSNVSFWKINFTKNLIFLPYYFRFMKYSQVCKTTLDQVVHCIYTASNMNGQNSLYGILTLLLVKDVLSSSASDSKKSTKSSMIDAFLLAWFTHLTTKILADLQYHLFGPDAMMEIFEAKTNKLENGNEMKNGNTEDASEANNHKEDKPKKKDHLRRRTRRLFISDSEGSDLSETIRTMTLTTTTTLTPKMMMMTTKNRNS